MPSPQDIVAPARFPHAVPMGLSGMLVRFSDLMDDAANRAALAFRAAVEAEAWDGVEESATSLGSVFLRFDPQLTGHAALAERVAAMLAGRDWYAEALPTGRRLWHIPALFGGPEAPQLEEAASLAGLSPEAAVADLTARPVRVLTIGFAPGLPYMGFLRKHWDIPRQTELTPIVPAGSVIVAVRQLIIFPIPTPTGWRHVGQTGFRGFRPEADSPFPLRAGDEVQFHAVSADKLDRLRGEDPDGGGAWSEALE
ncbi:5-oxoprolinase subunit B family protein [Defluviimonas sp. SAOS-178_SWC]|uniref:5-oxoprolinase subunit B family protein n=1 Tax=Defluviimonas sp. SAOS-178_SWC TaxID=3121287 RepID=UPI0032214862